MEKKALLEQDRNYLSCSCVRYHYRQPFLGRPEEMTAIKQMEYRNKAQINKKTTTMRGGQMETIRIDSGRIKRE